MTNKERGEWISKQHKGSRLWIEIEEALDEAEKRGKLEGKKEGMERAAEMLEQRHKQEFVKKFGLTEKYWKDVGAEMIRKAVKEL